MHYSEFVPSRKEILYFEQCPGKIFQKALQADASAILRTKLQMHYLLIGDFKTKQTP